MRKSCCKHMRYAHATRTAASRELKAHATRTAVSYHAKTNLSAENLIVRD
ncbi:MAG: hypothetical protein F6K26_38570 [Moorea sp. SIO2I5]|nr:hypothetical protein [Moorena sp. SIO2I5]